MCAFFFWFLLATFLEFLFLFYLFYYFIFFAAVSYAYKDDVKD